MRVSPNFNVMAGLLDCKFVSFHIFICILIFLLGMYIKLSISVCMRRVILYNVNLMYLNHITHPTFKLIIFLVVIKKEQCKNGNNYYGFIAWKILESHNSLILFFLFS